MKALILGILVALGNSTIGAAPVPSADEVMTAALQKAAAGNKAVYLHFGASWCGWCKRHDAFLEQSTVKPVFEKYFVPVKLVVQESEKNKGLENPGADAWLKKIGGPGGLPFTAFLDVKGALILNSSRPSEKNAAGDNIGHPMEEKEIDWFITMMKKAAPSMAAEDVKAIESVLRAQKK